MKIALGCDHGGFVRMQEVKAHLEELGIEYKDCGCYSLDRAHYPVHGEAAARAVASGECDFGIVVCTSGIGISIAANKVKGIRCACCSDTFSAEMTRRHNDANMLAFGASVVGKGLAIKLVDAFLNAEFEGGGRHEERVNMLKEMEENFR